MAGINPILQLTQDTFSDEGYVGVAELSRALQTEASFLTPYVVQASYTLGGDFESNNFPMLALTKGKLGGSKGVKLTQYEYKYAIMGRIKKETVIVSTPYAAGDKLGLGGSNFKIRVKDKQFSKYTQLYLGSSSANKIILRTQDDGVKMGTYVEYTVHLVTSSTSDFILGSQIQVGRVLAEGAKIVPIEGSDGVSSTSQLPGIATNMISYVRESVNVRGNVSNKVMKYTIKIDGKSFSSYLDWNLFLANMRFQNTEEEHLWWSKYTKSDTGEFLLYDMESNKPVTSGAGIDEQITNSTTYSQLTYAKLARVIRDVTFDSGANKANLVIWTGTGGAEQFNDAMVDKLAAFGFVISSDKFVEGQNSWDMTFGSFFKTFKHVDGHTVTIMKHKMFDKGAWSRAVDTHPVTGLPLTSYDMYFIDMSTYDGQANVMYVYEEGREFQQFVLNGAIKLIGYDNSNVRVSAKDEASIHMFNSCGIQILKTGSCFKMHCVAS